MISSPRKIDVISEGYFLTQPDEKGGCPRNCRITLLPNNTLVVSVIFNLGVGTGLIYSRVFSSKDFGKTWKSLGMMCDWSKSEKEYSERLNISRTPHGKLLALGMLYETPAAGTTYYARETGGAADTSLFFTTSDDEGITWSQPQIIAMCYPEPPEVGGVICATRQGRWLAPFAPWLDRHGSWPNRGKAAVMISYDRGKTWTSSAAFLSDPSGTVRFQEVWVEELSDGRVVGIGWQQERSGDRDYPNAYSISLDGGESFGPTLSTGLMGQAVAMRALEGGRVAVVYNRRHENPGVGLAIARPDHRGFNVEFDGLAWSAQSGFRGEVKDEEAIFWADFSFGEPAVEVLPDGSFFVVFWCHEKNVQGSRYCHVRLV